MDKDLNKSAQDQRIEEMRKLVEESNRLSEGKQLSLLPLAELGGEDIGFDISLLKDTADPDTSYRLYYTIRRILMDNLPSGKKNKKLRQMVYDEKNLFLNRGKQINERGIRGSDGRQAYIPTFLEPTFKTVSQWVVTGGSSFDLFMAFWNLNEAHGFHEETEQKAEPSFDQTLQALLNVPPQQKDKPKE